MTSPEPYEGRLTTVEATLKAERLLAAFDNMDGTFGATFLAADRDVLGAMIAYASAAMRSIAAEEGCELAAVRRAVRLRVSDLQAANEQKERDR